MVPYSFGPGGSYCPTCNEESIAEEDRENREHDAAQRQRALASKKMSLIAACQLGPRFQGVTFESFHATCQKAEQVLAFCSRYAVTFLNRLADGDNILMVGNCGTGKNHLSAAIANAVMEDDFAALHTTALKLVRRVKATWSRRDEDEQEVIDSFTGPDLLIIDEVGVQFGSDTEKMILTEVINSRYESKKPTIIISNLSLADLEVYLGHRAIDRFHEGHSKVLVFDWESYRRRQEQGKP